MTKRRDRLGFKIAALYAMAFCVLAIGCGNNAKDSTGPGPPSRSVQPTAIVMGGVYPMTGPLAVFGTAAADGLLEGVSYANSKILARTPYRLEAKIEDSRGEPQTGVLAYRRLVDSNRAGVVNTILSNVAVSLKPLADEENVLLFADSTHPSLTGGMTLRHSQTAEQEALLLLAHCRGRLNASSIYAVVSDDDYGVALEGAFGNRAEGIRYDPKAANLNAIAATAIAKNPDAVILVGVGGPLGELIRAMREMGYKGELVSTLGFSATPSARSTAGAAAIGLYHTVLVQNVADFAQETSSTLPDMEGASNVKIIEFNNAVFVAKAIADGHKTPQAIRKAILSQANLSGVGTSAKPQPDGTLQPELAIRRVE